MQDFENLLAEAHARNIQVILDLVLNHTSTRHKWFLEAKKGDDNPYRHYYIWKTPQEIKDQGIETRLETADSHEKNPWHWATKTDQQKYYGMFWSEMPDLNPDHRPLREELYAIAKFWLNKGVNGFRLDAAKHIYPSWQAEKAHQFWEEFRTEVESVNPNAYIVGEVWTSAEEIAPFFKGLKANFNFDLAEKILNFTKHGNSLNDLLPTLLYNYQLFSAANPNFVDATFLSNHDQNRVGSMVNRSKKKLKLAASILLTLPGNPFIYYGEELGMLGRKPDENIREAFLWAPRFEDHDRTNWKKPKYNTDSKVSPLSLQSQDPKSVYHHYKKLINIRKSFSALKQVQNPNLEEVPQIENENLLAFIRPHKYGDVLAIHNLSSEKISFSLPQELKRFNYLVLGDQDANGNFTIFGFQSLLIYAE